MWCLGASPPPLSGIGRDGGRRAPAPGGKVCAAAPVPRRPSPDPDQGRALKVGDEAFAVIKASDVMIGKT